jgi:pyrimidine-nucleoside phosphorylase
MNTVELILKKRRGERLMREELEYLINGYCHEKIPDYQMAAWCMAVCFQGMTPDEARDLTEIMAASGAWADLSVIPGIKVDKHSTGGVGDKTSLIIGPLVASVGVPVCKMSGRGLGHTGGTIDKLESIPGLRTDMSPQQLMEQVRRIGIGIAGQTKGMVPADKKLYALRDVTGTVDSSALIAASIMSKKLAGGADAIVLDVKVGNGAFLKDLPAAEELARLMVSIGNRAGRKTVALLTDMDQPLGRAVGNALEVREVIETLQGDGPQDLVEVSLALGAHMLCLAQKVSTVDEGWALLQDKISSGEGLNRFGAMIEAQGGDPRVVKDLSLIPQASCIRPVISRKEGYLTAVDTEEVGRIAMGLGAGRVVKEATIDPAVGLIINKKIGDRISFGDTLGQVYGQTEGEVQEAMERLSDAMVIDVQPVKKKHVIIKEIN